MLRNFIKTKALLLILSPSLFDFDSLGKFEGYSTISYNTLLYSILITFHPETINDIAVIRKQIDLSILPYPKPPNMESLIQLEFMYVDQSKRSLYRQKIRDFLQKYKLSDTWELPISVKILTDTLPIPGDTGKISWHKGIRPEDYPENNSSKNTDEPNKPKTLSGFKETIEKTIFTPLYREQLAFAEKIKYPAIFIEEEIDTKQELIKWIEINWKSLIKPSLSKLPKRNIKKAWIDTIALGIWVRNLRQQNTDWDSIMKQIGDIEDKDPDFFGKDGAHIKSRTDLQKILSDVENDYLKRFYPY